MGRGEDPVVQASGAARARGPSSATSRSGSGAPHLLGHAQGQRLDPGDARALAASTHWRFSTPQTAMTAKPAGPPDGGWGWVVAAAAFLVNGLSYGLLRSLGLALPALAEHFDRSAQDTAWVSALALAVQQAASPVGSALSTRWGSRPVVMVGGVLTSLGFVFSAFAGSLLHLYLGLGLLAGEGGERGD